jgi:dTDP-4-dehydrorhamnose reductase
LEKIRKKVLVLGGVGMLGHVLFKKLIKNKLFEVHDITRNKENRLNNFKCDVTNFDSLFEIVKNVKPHFIVNCIGVLIKESNENPSNAVLINSALPHKLVQFSKAINAKFIHISTDCVFDGSKGTYIETDKKTAQDTYGLSKSLGEINDDKNLTLRTSIIGPELKDDGEGLFSWFINQRGEVSGFTESIWGGVTTLVLADIIIKSINENHTGLIHITNGKPISKYDLLNLIKDKFELNKINLKRVFGKKSDKSLKTKFSYFQIPTYEEMILDMKNFIKKNNYT